MLKKVWGQKSFFWYERVFLNVFEFVVVVGVKKKGNKSTSDKIKYRSFTQHHLYEQHTLTNQ